MNETLIADAPAGDDAEIEAAIARLLIEVERNREKMQRDQEEIDRLKARTRATLEQLEAA